MNDIVIGIARVIGIEEITLDAPKSQVTKHAGPAFDGGGITGPIGLSGISAFSKTPVEPEKPKSLIVSRLKIESSSKLNGFTTVEGIMTIPGQLPFGKTFELTLHDPGMGVMDINGRMFKEDASLKTNPTNEV